MNARQKAFVEAYSGNATAAALAAWYTSRSAYSQGQRLLKNAEVAAAIRARDDKRNGELIADRSERQRFWSKVMRDGGEATKDRLKASELLGKSSGDFITKAEISGPDGGPIAAEIKTETDAERLARFDMDDLRLLEALILKMDGDAERAQPVIDSYTKGARLGDDQRQRAKIEAPYS